MKPPQRPCPSPLLRSHTGFTLVELAVGTAISALVIVITTAVFAPQLRVHQRLGGQLRLQERWSRMRFLLNTEIAEAHSVRSVGSGLELITCEPLAPGNASSARCSDGASPATGSPGYDIATCYELLRDQASGTSSLQRRGPMIKIDGALRTQGASRSCADKTAETAEVVTTGVTAFSAPVITEHKVTYTISLRDPLDPNGSSYTKESSASPRPRKY